MTDDINNNNSGENKDEPKVSELYQSEETLQSPRALDEVILKSSREAEHLKRPEDTVIHSEHKFRKQNQLWKSFGSIAALFVVGVFGLQVYIDQAPTINDIQSVPKAVKAERAVEKELAYKNLKPPKQKIAKKKVVSEKSEMIADELVEVASTSEPLRRESAATAQRKMIAVRELEKIEVQEIKTIGSLASSNLKTREAMPMKKRETVVKQSAPHQSQPRYLVQGQAKPKPMKKRKPKMDRAFESEVRLAENTEHNEMDLKVSQQEGAYVSSAAGERAGAPLITARSSVAIGEAIVAQNVSSMDSSPVDKQAQSPLSIAQIKMLSLEKYPYRKTKKTWLKEIETLKEDGKEKELEKEIKLFKEIYDKDALLLIKAEAK